MLTAFQKLYIPPDKNTNANFYRALMYANISSASFHFFFIFLFRLAGITPMAIVNIGSVVILTSGIILQRQGKVLFSIIIGSSEVIIHAILAVYYTGWNAGFQQYLLALAVYAFLIPRRRVLSIIIVALSVSWYIYLYYYSASHIALYATAHTFMKYFFIPNTVIAIVNAVYAISYYMNILDRAETALEKAHEKSESLLNNILPASIAERLKENNKTIAENFKEASVLFADIEGFTPFSQNIDATQLVNMLNDIFSMFDALVEKYALEKIKTIGDAYMVASGIPVSRSDHAEVLANFALEMESAFMHYNHAHNFNLRLRIGINSGAVVAGVIGKLRFIYDMWGDCVNIASRMESHGIPGKIQVTETTYELLKDKFSFEERGTIAVKGKGMMKTFLLGQPL